MEHPLIARRMNRLLTSKVTQPLSPEFINHADKAIRRLHVALREQTQPPYRRPEHDVDGWGLTATPIEQHGEFMDIPILSLLGHRAIYLSTTPDRMLRVLTAPHPRRALEERVIQIRGTSVGDLLKEDPTLYCGLLDAAEESIEEFGLNYQMPELTLPTDNL